MDDTNKAGRINTLKPNDENKIFSSLKLSSGNRHTDGRRLSSPNMMMVPSVEVPFPQGTLARVPDVDGKSSYIRRMSKSHVDPLENLNIDERAQNSYINEAFLPDKDKDNLSMTSKISETKEISIPINFPPNQFRFYSSSNSYKPNEISQKDDLISRVSSKFVQVFQCYGNWWKWICFFLYNIYLGAAIFLTWNKAQSYCDGVKFLSIVTAIVYLVIFNRFLHQNSRMSSLFRSLKDGVELCIDKFPILKKIGSLGFILSIMSIYIAYIIWNQWTNAVSLAGIFGFIAIGYLMSSRRSKINWSILIRGISLQFLLGVIVIRTKAGQMFFDCLSNKVTNFLNFTNAGSEFVFGYLSSGKVDGTSVQTQAVILVFKVFPVIIFFSFCTSILYHFGIMQVVVEKFGRFLRALVGTSSLESISASSNIFLGMTEAPLVIKPYLNSLTESELFAVMTGGFATIAGSILAAYVTFGVNASYLLSASVMAAPGALGISKLFYPETKEHEVEDRELKTPKKTHNNALEAASSGAIDAVKIIACITANLIGFIAFIRFLDELLSWIGSLVDMEFITFGWLLSKAFVPVALMMGVEWDESDKVAQLIGLKTLVNEFVAYKKLTEFKAANKLSPKSEAIATFALCGFSNLASIGIQVGGLGAMAPGKKSELARMGFKAMIAGSLVSFVSAAISGLLYSTSPV